jgi:hypothetical protein
VNGFDSFFQQYAERYMAADAEAVAAMYEAPLLACARVARSTSPTGRRCASTSSS